MKKLIMIILLSSGVVLSIPDLYSQTVNPLLQEWDTPFGVPPFELIKESHFLEAYEIAMAKQIEEVDKIINQGETTFENTIEALENSFKPINKISAVFYNLVSANTNPEIQKIAQQMAPMLSSHNDNIYLNDELYAKVKTVQRIMSTKPADEKSKLLEETLKKFVRNGANLSAPEKVRLKAINAELSLASVKFGENVLGDINDSKLILTEQEHLAGLPPSVLNAAKLAAEKEGIEEGYLFTISPTSMQPFLTYAAYRPLRERLMVTHLSKGMMHDERNNIPLIQTIVKLRAEKAQMLGYNTHAHFVLEESMAKTPEKVVNFLQELWKPALAMVQNELEELQFMAKAQDEFSDIKPWDWAYYTEKLRKEKFDLSDEEIRPYFELEQTKQGMFEVINRLWGLNFNKLDNMPVYHEEVQVYEVTESNGKHVGVIYMDFHPRASKRGGAWMSSFRKQYYEGDQRIHPVVTIVCNFTRPTSDKPALLSFREVETMYHEMGHALHGLLSDVKYSSLSGTSVPRDFVELPSQIMENWIGERSVLKELALHYETKQPIPDELLDKMEASAFFNKGFVTTEYLAASFLDMEYHTLREGQVEDIEKFEKMVAENLGLPEAIPYRYRSTYFNHIFSGGYSSGYYSYIWSEILDADAFQAFKETGNLFDKETAAKFRKYILEKGGTEDPMDLYKLFRGQEPDPRPLLERRGLIQP
jgi:peptidyl-dipeptidase Dcp